MIRQLLFTIVASFSICNVASSQADSTAQKLAQAQLDGYNNRDIDAFLLPYADTVRVYNYPDQLLYQGKTTMRQEYSAMFKQLVDLHCTLVKRMVLGNTVIDEESVIFEKGKAPMRAIAIYTIDKDKIAAVRFIVNQ